MKPCYDKAVELLARAPHFREQLGAKLLQRGYQHDEVEATLERLAAQGYLNDREAADGFVAARRSRGTEGKVRLKADLVRRGAAPEAIASALAEVPDDDLTAARAAAERWLASGGKSRPSLARHLDRKGFSRRAIVSVLGESSAAFEADAEPDDLADLLPETGDGELP
jgi:regulatory protein